MTVPKLPHTSVAISETHLSLIALRANGGGFEPRHLGVLRLPPGLVKASFTEPNIVDEGAMGELLRKTATQAGAKGLKGLSISLPTGSARSVVVSMESAPNSRAELEQMIEWKTERSLGHKFSELRVNHTRLRDFNGRSQWIICAASERVLEQYERIFDGLDWQVGLIVPRHIGEAQWLMRSGRKEDQVVLSLNSRGFEAVIVRGNEPVLVREVTCPLDERENEFYRLMVFYRDRMTSADSPARLSRLLVIGNLAEQRSFGAVLASALESNTVLLGPQHLGLRVDSNAPFNHFAAAGGLATMAWN
ncbi:MAG TPA: hypothetical protein VJ302_12530 [Blastocatellia bacterium]|nr:hypothetical protein [Blastocatellia bacterium]